MSRVSRVARALCVADGNDPEALIDLGGEVVDVGDMAWHREGMEPAWTSYIGEARRIIAAIVALELVAQPWLAYVLTSLRSYVEIGL